MTEGGDSAEDITSLADRCDERGAFGRAPGIAELGAAIARELHGSDSAAPAGAPSCRNTAATPTSVLMSNAKAARVATVLRDHHRDHVKPKVSLDPSSWGSPGPGILAIRRATGEVVDLSIDEALQLISSGQLKLLDVLQCWKFPVHGTHPLRSEGGSGLCFTAAVAAGHLSSVVCAVAADSESRSDGQLRGVELVGCLVVDAASDARAATHENPLTDPGNLWTQLTEDMCCELAWFRDAEPETGLLIFSADVARVAMRTELVRGDWAVEVDLGDCAAGRISQQLFQAPGAGLIATADHLSAVSSSINSALNLAFMARVLLGSREPCGHPALAALGEMSRVAAIAAAATSGVESMSTTDGVVMGNILAEVRRRPRQDVLQQLEKGGVPPWAHAVVYSVLMGKTSMFGLSREMAQKRLTTDVLQRLVTGDRASAGTLTLPGSNRQWKIHDLWDLFTPKPGGQGLEQGANATKKLLRDFTTFAVEHMLHSAAGDPLCTVPPGNCAASHCAARGN